MSFGTVSSTPTGGGSTLTGFILSKASQSRKEAKKKDRSQERKEKKKKESSGRSAKTKEQKSNPASKLLGNLPKIGDLFSFKKPQVKNEEPRTRTSGGATGLAQILTQGFGSLSADTMGISSGLASVTQVMNSSLKAQSFTATGIQTIASILSDQLENQGSILSTVKSLRPGGGKGGGGKSLFGTSRSKGTSSDTLTEALINAAIEKGIGRFIASRLSRLNPFNRNKPPSSKPPTGGSNNPKGSYYDDAVKKSQQNAQRLRQQGFMGKLKDIGEGFKGKAAQATNWGKGVLGKGVEAGKGLLGKAKGFGDSALKSGASLLDNPITRRISLAGAKFGGRMLPVAGTGFSAAEAADRAKKGDVVGAWLAGLGGGAGATATATSAAALSGVGAVVPGAAEATSMVADIGLLGWDIANAFKPMAQGGVMVGESAGSQGEEVMSLTSAAGRKITGDKGSTSDPGMQASAASTLSVVDQFIKGMGPLGSPVAQALGPDIANLTRTFGMSQTLPNLKIGGGKFKEDGNAKRTRDDFLQKLISGSLEALDAKKKKDENAPAPAPTGPGSTGTPEQQAAADERAKQQIEAISPGGMKMTTMTSDGQQVQVRESVDKIAGVKIGTTTPNLFGQEENVIGPGTSYRPVEGTNKERWYDSDGRLYSWKPGTRIRELTPQEMKAGWNGRTFLRKPDTGHVRAHQGTLDILNITPSTPAIGEYSYTRGAVLVPQQSDPKKGKWQPEDKEQGRFGGRAPSLPPATDIKLQQGGKVKQKPWWDFLNMTQQKPKERELGSKAKLNGKDVYWAGKNYGWQQMKDSGSATMNSLNKPSVQKKFIQDKPKAKPRPQPARSPVAATQQASSDMDTAAVINIVSAGGGGGAAPAGSDKQTQMSSNYISNPWPNGLSGVICTSPWSVV